MNPIDAALLLSEWVTDSEGPLRNLARCPCCNSSTDWKHESGCVMDLALAERGFNTSNDRDAARNRLRASYAATLPPPSGKR